jgi:DNA-binding cell septation regulator SpoVG
LRIKAMANITFNDALPCEWLPHHRRSQGAIRLVPEREEAGIENWISYAHPVTRDASDKIQDAVIEHWKACTTPEQRGLSDGS